MKTNLRLAALLLGAAPAAALAQATPIAAPGGDTVLTVTADRSGITARQRAVPAQLSTAERLAWAKVFNDIEAGRYSKAEAGIAAQGASLIAETARAELIIARGTGKLSRADLAEWLGAHGDLPQATRVARLAAKLPGADSAPLPSLPSERAFRSIRYTPRMMPRSATGPGDTATADALQPLLSEDRNAEAEQRFLADAGTLSPGARAQWAQRIAWSYYSQNDNAAALRLGLEAARGPAGEWAALGAWTAGLAAFRTGQYDAAAKAFDLIATKDPEADLAASGAYWASRAHLAAGRPDLVAERLEAAARVPNSFHGLIARRALGLSPVQDWAEPDFITADWNHLRTFKGARRAAALMEIGQIGLADRELRHLAATSPEANYPALLRLAARLGLPATQYSLAVRPPLGIEAPLSARFPAPEWEPARGWRVDKSLVFAHALQESNFVTTATSRAGAKGIMQLMPGTAKLMTKQMGTTPATDLADPAFNIEVGQTYLEALRDMSYTEGLLPKVVAAYNAGPGSVQRWNTSLDDRGDPLLFIASIPFRETRHYVEVVLRNYWMYQLREGEQPASIDALIGGLWPRFPGAPGAAAVKRMPMPVQTLPSQPDRSQPRSEDPIITASAQ